MSRRISKQRGGVSGLSVTPIIMYGVEEADWDIVIEENWLESNFGGIDLGIYSKGIIDDYYDAMMYGFVIELNMETGQFTPISEQQKANIKKLYDILLHHHTVNRSPSMPKMGYFNAVTVDIVPNDLDEYVPIPLPEPVVVENTKNVPRNTTNVITMDPIMDGTIMANFHGESGLGRFYKKDTYNAMNPKRNPFTRAPIQPSDVMYYRARVLAEGGKRKTRRMRRH